MKKIICILLSAMFVLCLFTSCSEKDGGETTTTENSTTTEAESSTTTEAQGNETTLSQSNKTLNSQQTSDVGGGSLELLKYRMDYYSVPAPFADIVDSESFEKWYSVVIEENPNVTNEMVMKRFVEYFNISREDFDRANVEWAKTIKTGLKGQPVINPQDYANQEVNEVYNADIIYTFDDETINEYYLSHDYPFVYEIEFKQAVENGTYQTQTKDWIDIEKMEAEINAKYGTSNIEAQTTAEISAS